MSSTPTERARADLEQFIEWWTDFARNPLCEGPCVVCDIRRSQGVGHPRVVVDPGVRL